MKNFYFNKFVSLMIIILLLVGNIFVDIPVVFADNSKTITITFKSAPTPSSVLVNKAPIKYNKRVAFSWGFDDGYKEGYEYGFKYLSGGYNSTLNQYFNGLYFTDGAGNSRPFTGYFAWPSVNSLYEDIHTEASLSYMSWTDLIDSYNYGWMPLNHGWTSINFPDMGATFNYPAPHGPSLFDYEYEISQNNAHVLASSGITMNHFVIPGGDQSYIDPAWTVGEKSVASNTNSFYYGGLDHPVVTEGINVSDINLDHYVMHRESFSEGTNITNESMVEYIDSIVDKSSDSDRYWATGFTHRVVPGATGGNLSWDKFKYLMDHIATNYGRDGEDNVWMTSYQEAYDYFAVNQGVSLNTELVDDTLTISFDSSSLPNDLRHYALSLVVSADQEIKSINYGTGDFTAHSENLETGLINLDWGFFLDQDEYTKPELKVSTAESSRTSVDLAIAQGYVSVLPDGPEKNILQNRLDDISVLGKTWKINFGISGYTPAIWNIYGGDKAPYNQVLSNLIDTDGNTSSLSVQVVQDFTSKVTAGMNTGNNSGVIPDTYLQSLLRTYASTQQTGAVRFGGLDPLKEYDIFIVGSYNIASSSKSISLYTVKGVTQEFNVSQNTSTEVVFTKISPEADGTLDVSVSAKDPYFGYGALNAIKIRERSENKPSAVISSAVLRTDGSGLIDVDYILRDENSDQINLTNIEYSTTGLFSGEELSATSATDIQNDGINNLSSSIDGISHNFVWNASDDLGEFEGTVYLHFQPSSLTDTGAFGQTSGTQVDFKAPIISSINSTPGSTTSSISWSTHEDSYSMIDYGLTDSYGSTSGSLSSGSFLKNHTVSLSGLDSCSVYHYKISSRDGSDNDRESTDQTFNTGGCVNPNSSVPSGTYNSTQSVSLSAEGSDSIRYSITETPADCSSGTLYINPISVSSSGALYVRACFSTGESTTNNFTYVIDSEAPSTAVASPSSGTYNSTQSVALSAEGSDSIRYSITETPADCSSGTLYQNPIDFSSSGTLYVRACDNLNNSSTTSFTYTIGQEVIPEPVRRITGSYSYAYLQNLNQNFVKNNSNEFSNDPVKKISKDLKFGIRDNDVMILQKFLIKENKGKASVALGKNGVTNYFGKLTRSALAEWQKANGVWPPVGYFGPITRAKIKSLN